jgi:hypothetical protein
MLQLNRVISLRMGARMEEGGITGDEKKWMDNGFGGTMELKGWSMDLF